ncbi:MAG: DUF1611 domain-containing protein [Micromonosporaceae bacterium]
MISGSHYQLGWDAEIETTAHERGVRLWDLREPPRPTEVARHDVHRPGSWTTLAVGSDCSCGKMTTMLELDRGMSSTFVATGQTGIVIAGGGVPAEAVVSDFLTGAVEDAVYAACGRHDWVFSALDYRSPAEYENNQDQPTLTR